MLARGNYQSKCWCILRKSIITSAKKLLALVLYGTQILYFNQIIWLEHLSLLENTVKHIHFQDHRNGINALQQLCIIYLYFFFLADLNCLDTTSVKQIYYLFLLIKIYGYKLVQIKHNNSETKFIHSTIALKQFFWSLFK